MAISKHHRDCGKNGALCICSHDLDMGYSPEELKAPCPPIFCFNCRKPLQHNDLTAPIVGDGPMTRVLSPSDAAHSMRKAWLYVLRVEYLSPLSKNDAILLEAIRALMTEWLTGKGGW